MIIYILQIKREGVIKGLINKMSASLLFLVFLTMKEVAVVILIIGNKLINDIEIEIEKERERERVIYIFKFKNFNVHYYYTFELKIFISYIKCKKIYTIKKTAKVTVRS